MVTTIGFDGQADNTALQGQYTAQGVTFIKGTSIPGYRGCCFPVVNATPYANSAPNAVSAQQQCSQEFCTTGIAGQFGSFASFVRVYVGSLDGKPRSGTATLTAYDSNLKVIGQQTAPLPATVSTPLEVDAPGQEIAYFTVVSNDYNMPLGIDDLSYDVPASPPPPDFQLAVFSQSGVYAYPGVGGSEPITVQRFNGSTGPIDFGATDLPSGWSASFSPNPATDGDPSTQVTITPAPSTPAGTNTSVTIKATPGTPTAGSASRTLTIPVTVETPAGVSRNAYLTGCASSAPMQLSMGAQQPVDLSVVSPGNASVSPSHFDPNGSAYQPFTLNVKGPGDVVLRVKTGAYSADSTVSVTSNMIIKTAESGRSYGDNRDILLTGTGFCPGAKVQIGTQSAADASTPDWVSADGTRMTVPLSLLATSGPARVTGGAESAVSPGNVQVDGYRNINGFSFHNDTPSITFDQLTMAFGHDQTYDCFGVDVCVRDPWAMVVNAIANAAFGGSSGGDCFGFSLGSLRIYSGSLAYSQGKLVDQFPHSGGSDVYGIDAAIGAGGSDGPITDYLNAMQASQLSNEFLGHWLSEVVAHVANGNAASATDVYNQVNDSLHAYNSDFPVSTYPLIALRDGGSGHVVVAYGLEGTPSDYYIDVYDSNRPYAANETVDGSLHTKNVLESRIHVHDGGQWDLASSSMSGDMSGLVVTRPTDLPKNNPTMVGSGLVEQGAAAILFASGGSLQTGSAAAGQTASQVTQVTDANGHALFDATGNLNADPATRLAGAAFAPLTGSTAAAGGADTRAPFILLPGLPASLHETIADTGNGPDSHLLIGHGTSAEVDTQATTGTSDTLTLTSANTQVGFSTNAASKPLTLTITGRGAGRNETATVTTTSYRGGADTVGFAGGTQSLVIAHQGPTTTLSIKLAVSGAGSTPTVFQSGTIRIPANGTARLPRIPWGGLAAASLKLRVAGRTQWLQNRLRQLPRLTIRSLKAVHAGPTATFTLRLARYSVPRGAQVELQWVVRSGSTLVRTNTAIAATGAHTANWSFIGTTGQSYTVTVSATAVRTLGITQDAAPLTSRSLRFTA